MRKFVTIIFIIFSCNPILGQELESSNLPIMIIDTQGAEIPDEPKVTALMGIINNRNGAPNNINDPRNEYDGFIGIEIRGSSSRFFPKNSYGIETRDELGENLNVELLGMPEENDWVLHGPYSDKSLIRNLLAFKLGRDLGRYASRVVPVELVLNDQYWGQYMVMEKIKVDSNRVDIARLNPDENDGDDLTGGYMVKLDKYDGENSGDGWASPYRPPGYIRDEQYVFFQYHYPKIDEITQPQRQYIKDYVVEFESALQSDLYTHPELGYAKYIDVDSFVDFLIAMEVTRNVDGYRLSTFLYKDKESKGGKLTLGPIWDFNLGFGNADYCLGWAWDGWAYDFNDFCPGDYWLIPFWWDRLLSDPAFKIKLKSRWTELREGVYRTSVILNYIDEQASYLDEAQQRNFQKWPVLGNYVWPNSFVGNDYASEIAFLKEWIQLRLEWLDVSIGFVTAVDDSNHEIEITPYPNPFNEKVQFDISMKGEMEIYNVLGEMVYKSSREASEFSWDGRNNDGGKVKPGTYIYTISTPKGVNFSGRILKQ